MALASSVIWEVEATGSDTNGGGYDPLVTSPGTDYSRQSSAQIAFSDLVIGTNTSQLTSAANPFTALHSGNVINVTGGSGFTTGRYEILSVTGGVATVDRSVGVTGSTGGTGNLGGALASTGSVGAAMVSGNICFVKSGTYSITSASSNVANGRCNPPSGVSLTQPSMLIGYNTNRTILNSDTSPVFNTATNGTAVCQLDNNDIVVRNLSFTNTGNFTSTTGVSSGVGSAGSNQIIERCQANGLSTGFSINGSGGNVYCINCYAKSCTLNGFILGTAVPTGSAAFLFCTADGCGSALSSQGGFRLGAACVVAYCLSINNSGQGFDTQTDNTSDVVFYQCDAYNNTGTGIVGMGWITNVGTVHLVNCLAFGNSGDFRDNNDATPNYLSRFIGCAGTLNTPTTITTSANLIGFQTLTTNPWNNAGGKDFSLNNTAGGGASCRAAGQPSSYLGINTSAFFDIGAAEHGQVPYGIVVTPVTRDIVQFPIFMEQGRSTWNQTRPWSPPGRLIAPVQTIPYFEPEPGSSQYTLYTGLVLQSIVKTPPFVVAFQDTQFNSLVIPILAPGSASYTSKVSVPNVPPGVFTRPAAATEPVPFPQAGAAFYLPVGVVPVPNVQPPPGVLAAIVQPPFAPEPGLAAFYPSWELISVNPSTIPVFAAIAEPPRTVYPQGWSAYSYAATPQAIVKPPLPTFAAQVVVQPFPEAGQAIIAPFGVGVVPTPNQLPGFAVVAVQAVPPLPQFPEAGKASYLAVGVVPTPNVLPNRLVSAIASTPPQFDQGTAYYVAPSTWPVAIVPVPPATLAVQVTPQPFPEPGQTFNTVHPTPEFQMPARLVSAFQTTPIPFPEAGTALYMPVGVVPVPNQRPGVVVFASQVVSAPFPEAGSAYSQTPPPGTIPPPLPPFYVTSQAVSQPFPEPGAALYQPVGVVPTSNQLPIQPVIATAVLPQPFPEPGSAYKAGPGGPPVTVKPPLPTFAAQTVPVGFPEAGSSRFVVGVVPVPNVKPAPGVLAVQSLPTPAEIPGPGVAIYRPAGYVPTPTPPLIPAIVASQFTPQPFPEPGQANYMPHGVIPVGIQKPGYVLLVSQVVPPQFPEPGGVFKAPTPPQPSPTLPPYPTFAAAVYPPMVPELGSGYGRTGVVPVPVVKPGVAVQPVSQFVVQPFPDGGSSLTRAGVVPVPPANVPRGVFVVESQPYPYPAAGVGWAYQGPPPPFLTPGRVIFLRDIYVPVVKIFGKSGG